MTRVNDSNSIQFNYYKFAEINNRKTTQVVREFSIADGMKALIDNTPQHFHTAINKVKDWASQKGIGFSYSDPYPSTKYPGKAWIDVHFNRLTL